MIARRHPLRYVLLIAVAALCGASLLATEASAATIPAKYARQLYSVQSQGDTIFWFQRVALKVSKAERKFLEGIPVEYRNQYSYYSDSSGPGAILARQFNSSLVKPIYQPPPGQRIAGFKIRAGRIIVGLSARDDRNVKPTEVVELKQDGTAWTTTSLITRPGVVPGACGSVVSLLNVNDRGEVIVDDVSYESRGADCQLVRAISKLVAIAPDGTQREITSRISGWASDKDEISFDRLHGGPGDWYSVQQYTEWDDTGKLALENIETGEQFNYPQLDRDFYNYDLNAAGASLTMDPYSRRDRTLLFNDPRHLDKVIHLGRRNAITWFHLCEDKVIEIGRRRATQKRPAGKSWNVWTRDTNGEVQRKLDVRIARGTVFEACNGDFAFFHRYLRNQRVRQFAVPLNPAPGPTGTTGVTAEATGPTS